MKNLKFLTLTSLLIFLSSCNKSNNGIIETDNNKKTVYSYCSSNNGNHQGKKLTQFTPVQAQWCEMQQKVLNKYKSHAPKDFIKNSNLTMDDKAWAETKWNGKTINPENYKRRDFLDKLFPRKHILVGLKELYEKNKPFKDEKNPSKAEVDEWHRLVINHFRNVIGYKGKQNEVVNDHSMYMRALWSDEVKFTTQWDFDPKAKKAKQGGIKPHTGFTYVPPTDKQQDYFPSENFKLTGAAYAEGVSNVMTEYPWSVKLSAVLYWYIRLEGYWGGHVGPFVRREKMGLSFWDKRVKNSRNEYDTQVRDAFSGKLNNEKYNRNKHSYTDK